MTDYMLYRGTTALWEKSVIEGKSPSDDTNILGEDRYLQQSARMNRRFEFDLRARLGSIACSQLRSGKEIVLGNIPTPLIQLNAEKINAEIVKRVGAETAPGTPNYFSHFIPCGTNPGISNNFGHDEYYRFHIQGKKYGRTLDEIERYVSERNQLPSYIVPLFEGGNNEVLAYTGSSITSVEFMSGQNVKYTVFNSLD